MKIDNQNSYTSSSSTNTLTAANVASSKVSDIQTTVAPNLQIPGLSSQAQLTSLQQVIKEFKAIGAALSTMSQSAQQQIAKDKSNGIGTFQGASKFSSAVLGELAKFSSVKDAAGIVGSSAGSAGVGSAASGIGAAASFASGLGGTVGAVGNLINIFKAADDLKPGQAALGGAVNGAYIGTQILPGWGTAIGAVIGGLAGFAGSVFGSGKNKDQKARDKIRDVLENAGIIDSQSNLTLADGSKYDIGKDGGFRLDNVDGTQRQAFDVDFGNELAGNVVGLANPLAYLVTSGDKKLSSDFAGYFTNAALSNAKTPEDARQNMLAIFSKFNVSPQEALNGLAQLQVNGKITQEEFAASANGLRVLINPPEAQEG